MPNRPPRRVQFVRATLESLAPNQCLARVELSRPEAGSFVGTATGGSLDIEGLRTSARAAADALTQAVGKQHRIQVHHVELFDAFGEPMVLVHLGVQVQDRTRALIGFCMAGADPTRAAALAVLNAANRVLGVG